MINKLKLAGRALACSATMLLALAGCGGDGDGDATPAAAATPATVIFTGTAATGAAFTGAVITVIDSRGTLVGTSEPVGADGAYSVTVASGAVAPFVIIASRTSADGAVTTMVSVAESASVSRVNVTPITNLIAARLSPSGDPLKLSSELAAGSVQVTAASVSATVAEIKAILAPVLAATGQSDANPLSGTFATDGAGYDRLLDSIEINIVPASTTTSNIEIAVKTTTAGDSAAAPVIQFQSNQSVATITTTNNITTSSVGGSSVTTANLVAAGTSVLIANLLADMNTCYALPLSSRVSGVSGTVTAVTGTASAVIAPECKAIFNNSDPATFLSNGNKVGRDASNNGAFASLFRNGATGVVFSQGTYEFTRTNNDIVIGYKSRDTAGGENYDTLVVRKQSDGKLRLVGNQYTETGGVAAYHQLRQFVTLDQSGNNYWSSGYTLNVDNVQVSGNPKYLKVEVTTPSGNTVTLWPSAGNSFLVFKRTDNNQLSGTNFLRMAAAYAGSSATFSAAVEPNLVFANPLRTDTELAAIPQQSAWTFKYFLAANATATPDYVQSYKTRARALAIGELKLKGLATLVPSLLAEISTGANTTTGMIDLDAGDKIDISGTGDTDAWTVPSGALPPTNVKAFGRNTTATAFSWDDSTNVPSSARKTIVSCQSTGSVSDTHCGSGGTYSADNHLNGIHLFSRDVDGREYANFFAMYKLTPAP